jgi:beta-galactosidase
MLTFKDNKFYLNNEEFKIQSGAFHYFRALPDYWEDILTKIKAAGLNCVETYICWNLHEPKKGRI